MSRSASPKLPDPPLVFEPGGPQTGIGHPLVIARDVLVRHARAGRHGAKVPLDEGRVVLEVRRVGHRHVGFGRQRQQCARLQPHVEHAAGRRAVVLSGRRAGRVLDERREQVADLHLDQGGVLALVQLVDPQEDRGQPRDAAKLPARQRLEQVQHLIGRHADGREGVGGQGGERIARTLRQHGERRSPPLRVELDAGPQPPPGVVPEAVEWHLFAVDQLHLQRERRGERRAVAEAAEGLAALHHGADGGRRLAVEARHPAGVGVVGESLPQLVQPRPHRGVGVLRARLDAVAHGVRHQGVDGGCDPGIVS